MEPSFDHQEPIDLPPGFRFHPTDEELISHYLYPKVSDTNFSPRAIGEVDLNKVEPWELPWRAKLGEQEWFFFCVRDRKYPTGSRTNRATSAGYWKATGKDKEIYKGKSLVGMKKTLVFYKGRAPKGEKTDWVMHEYRLEGEYSAINLPKYAKGEWVISRVFHKSSGGKKIPISGLLRMKNGKTYEHDFGSADLPPLMEISSVEGGSRTETSHVTCFSESMEEQKPNNEELMGSWSSGNSLMASRTNNVSYSCENVCFPSNQMVPNVENFQYQDTSWMQEPSILKILMDASNDSSVRQNPKTELVDDQDYGMNLGGQVDIDYLWNY